MKLSEIHVGDRVLAKTNLYQSSWLDTWAVYEVCRVGKTVEVWPVDDHYNRRRLNLDQVFPFDADAWAYIQDRQTDAVAYIEGAKEQKRLADTRAREVSLKVDIINT